MSVTGNVLDHLKAEALLSSTVEPPAWIGKAPVAWPADEVLAAKNGLIHLPALAAGNSDYHHPPTPRFFNLAGLDYAVETNAPEPVGWLEFLRQLWGDDEEAIRALQEWFGYCLTPDTSHQKIAMLVGPRRSGKGTIARVLRALVGPSNVAGPTLSSLATNFGLWPLIGKPLAIISDARLSHRTDQATIVERLLSISGEDALTIDRKHAEPITCKLPTRLMIMTNELPRFDDASQALASRLIVWQLTVSFFGREDHALTDRLLPELPGILLWAIQGWRRLRERGYFVQPSSGAELLGAMEDLASPVAAFVHECCETGAGEEFRVVRQDLYRAYRRWCGRKNIVNTADDATFGRNLRAVLPTIGTSQPRIDGKKVRVYLGIRLAGGGE